MPALPTSQTDEINYELVADTPGYEVEVVMVDDDDDTSNRISTDSNEQPVNPSSSTNCMVQIVKRELFTEEEIPARDPLTISDNSALRKPVADEEILDTSHCSDIKEEVQYPALIDDNVKKSNGESAISANADSASEPQPGMPRKRGRPFNSQRKHLRSPEEIFLGFEGVPDQKVVTLPAFPTFESDDETENKVVASQNGGETDTSSMSAVSNTEANGKTSLDPLDHSYSAQTPNHDQGNLERSNIKGEGDLSSDIQRNTDSTSQTKSYPIGRKSLKELGRNFRKRREKLGVTQVAVTKALAGRNLGCVDTNPQSAVSRFESGNLNPRDAAILRPALFDWLLEREAEAEKWPVVENVEWQFAPSDDEEGDAVTEGKENGIEPNGTNSSNPSERLVSTPTHYGHYLDDNERKSYFPSSSQDYPMQSADQIHLNAIGRDFRKRRLKLGLTQKEVGRCLADLNIPFVDKHKNPESAIWRFEQGCVPARDAAILKPAVYRWLLQTEAEAKNNEGDFDLDLNERRWTADSEKYMDVLGRDFRKRRMRLGFGQKAVGKCLVGRNVPFLDKNPETAINRFERGDLTAKDAAILKPVVYAWLLEKEAEAKSNGDDPDHDDGQKNADLQKHMIRVGRDFKKRRRRLGFTQKAAGKCLVGRDIPFVDKNSESAINRFERGVLMVRDAAILEPVAFAWLLEREAEAKLNGVDFEDDHQNDESQKHLEAIGRDLKIRRLKLGFTQKDVGICLAGRNLPFVDRNPQNTIYRFEQGYVTVSDAAILEPALYGWLQEREAEAKNNGVDYDPGQDDCQSDAYSQEHRNEIGREFKDRRLKLGISQKVVGRCLVGRDIPFVDKNPEKTINRFECGSLTAKDTAILEPVADAWLLEREEEAKISCVDYGLGQDDAYSQEHRNEIGRQFKERRMKLGFAQKLVGRCLVGRDIPFVDRCPESAIQRLECGRLTAKDTAILEPVVDAWLLDREEEAKTNGGVFDLGLDVFQRNVDPKKEMVEMGRDFKKRRKRLGLSQKAVGRCLAGRDIPFVDRDPESAIQRFECGRLTAEDVAVLKPVVFDWLQEREAEAKINGNGCDLGQYDADYRKHMVAIGRDFKKRRIQLGVTQKGVGRCLARRKLPFVDKTPQSAIYRFECGELTPKDAAILEPALYAWLHEREAEVNNPEDGTTATEIDKKELYSRSYWTDIGRDFRKRRINLGVTQKAVGRCIAGQNLPGVDKHPQKAISFFESGRFGPKTMLMFKAALDAWLLEKEAEARRDIEEGTVSIDETNDVINHDQRKLYSESYWTEIGTDFRKRRMNLGVSQRTVGICLAGQNLPYVDRHPQKAIYHFESGRFSHKNALMFKAALDAWLLEKEAEASRNIGEGAASTEETNDVIDLDHWNHYSESYWTEIGREFRKRRVKLGISQKAVGISLAGRNLPYVDKYPDKAISRFESGNFNPKNAAMYKAALDAWLLQKEAEVNRNIEEGTAIAEETNNVIDLDQRSLYSESYMAKIGNDFRKKRMKLGLSQRDVGKCLAGRNLPYVDKHPQKAIYRFESGNFNPRNAAMYKAALDAWLLEKEAEVNRTIEEGTANTEETENVTEANGTTSPDPLGPSTSPTSEPCEEDVQPNPSQPSLHDHLNMKEIGLTFKTRRMQLGVSQEAVGICLTEQNIFRSDQHPQSTISRFECGNLPPKDAEYLKKALFDWLEKEERAKVVKGEADDEEAADAEDTKNGIEPCETNSADPLEPSGSKLTNDLGKGDLQRNPYSSRSNPDRKLEAARLHMRTVGKKFRKRRLKLGMTQDAVGKLFLGKNLPVYEAWPYTTISRFESGTLTTRDAAILEPVLFTWLQEAERRKAGGGNEGTEEMKIEVDQNGTDVDIPEEPSPISKAPVKSKKSGDDSQQNKQKRRGKIEINPHVDVSMLNDSVALKLKGFARRFKKRRIKLGFTQIAVSQDLHMKNTPGFKSSHTVSRFENGNYTKQKMKSLKPYLADWLREREEAQTKINNRKRKRKADSDVATPDEKQVTDKKNEQEQPTPASEKNESSKQIKRRKLINPLINHSLKLVIPIERLRKTPNPVASVSLAEKRRGTPKKPDTTEAKTPDKHHSPLKKRFLMKRRRNSRLDYLQLQNSGERSVSEPAVTAEIPAENNSNASPPRSSDVSNNMQFRVADCRSLSNEHYSMMSPPPMVPAPHLESFNNFSEHTPRSFQNNFSETTPRSFQNNFSEPTPRSFQKLGAWGTQSDGDLFDIQEHSIGTPMVTEPRTDIGFFNNLLPHIDRITGPRRLLLMTEICQLVYRHVYAPQSVNLFGGSNT